MYATLVGDARILSALLELDAELATEARREGCPYCGGRLHSARYPRKPRGGLWQVGEEHDFRHSLCCAEEGCRRRTTPASVRFLGRRVYLGVVVVLAAVLMQGPTPWRVARICGQLGVSRRTLIRWRRWWVGRFATSRWWSVMRASLVPPVAEIPRGLLHRFVGEPADQLIALLRWLSPAAGRAF